MTMSTRIILLGACLLVWVLPLQAQWGNWPGWRGDGNGVSHETGLPVERSEISYRWKTRIPGTGNSSPIVWGNLGLLATGVRPPAMSQGKSEDEDEKRLSTVLFAGDPVIHIDNCERALVGACTVRC